MNIKKTPIKPKKIPYYLALSLLTVGASLILGFLSFGGMFALFPMLSVAFAAFGLSVAYEGEIYLQNIKGALSKLFQHNYLQNYLGKEYLLENFPKDTKAADCPQFFKDYEIQLKLLGAFGHKELKSESKKRKKQIEKTLSDMEKWFAVQLFSANTGDNSDQSAYAKQLQLWIAQHDQNKWVERLEGRRVTFNIVKAFSITAALFMTLGSTYLILEAFLVIPALAALPFLPILIVPMALIAGLAYGMLTYNAVTDLINNNSLLKLFNKLRTDINHAWTVRNVLMATTAGLLVFLAIALTICTAGTWWTIASNASPLFEWMKKMPSFIMGVINPIITGLSSLSFNIQNTAESLDMVDDATKNIKRLPEKIDIYLTKAYENLRKTENWVQILNPFRIILKLTITPLRILLFIGHLLSIAVTADRMPGFPQILSALIALISEGFEDMHYFVPSAHHHHHDEKHEHTEKHHHHHHEHEKTPADKLTDDAHEHKHHHEKHHHVHSTHSLLIERLGAGAGHNHNTDIPTLILKTITAPIYALATVWDFLASGLNQSPEGKEKKPAVLTLNKAWNKQRGNAAEHDVELSKSTERPSKEWQKEHVVSRIERYKSKHFDSVIAGHDIANAKVVELDKLKTKIRTAEGGLSLVETLKEAQKQPVYNQHRLFIQPDEKTATQRFIDELPERVNAL